MSGRTTAVLFVILLLLAGFLIWQNQQEDAPEIVTAHPTRPPGPVTMLSDYSMADLHRLTITHLATGESLDYLYDPQEEQTRWRLAEGSDPFLGGMLDMHMPAFMGLRYTRTIDITAQTNLTDFGLDPPPTPHPDGSLGSAQLLPHAFRQFWDVFGVIFGQHNGRMPARWAAMSFDSGRQWPAPCPAASPRRSWPRRGGQGVG
jgi:hypothetical protein